MTRAISLPPVSAADEIRFWRKVSRDVDAGQGCWEWSGTKARGYGQFSLRGRSVYAHRVAHFLATRKRLPAELQIDHLCRNRACCNPAHLEAVTPAENTRRGLATQTICVALKIQAAARRGAATCKRGHAWTEANSYWSGGNRSCRACVLRRSPRL